MTNIELLIKLQELQLLEATTGSPPPAMPRSALRRDGVSQSERFPAALHASHFQIDEREMEDLLELTLELAGHIRFQDGLEGDRLDWQVFFRKDLSVILARIIRYKLDGWHAAGMVQSAQVQGHLQELQKQPALDFSSEAKAAFRDLVTWLRQGSSEFRSPHDRIFRWQLRMPADHPFATQINAAMHSVVNPATNMIDEAEALILADCATSLQRTETAGRAFELLSHAMEMLAQECRQVQASARRHFAASLTDFPSHSPHAGLFIAFLQLIRVAQVRLNELGPAQLDFYFKEVLRFVPASAEPDHAHLVGTVNAGTERVLIPEGTRFLTADKRAYVTRQNWTLNPANLSQTLGLRRGFGIKALGMGGIKDADWPGMDGMGVTGAAELGWVVGSRMLHMRGGNRTVYVAMGLAQGILPTGATSLLLQMMFTKGIRVRVTTSKGWQSLVLNKAFFHHGNASSAPDWFPATLQGEQVFFLEARGDSELPPIVGYDPLLHGTGFSGNAPLAQFSWTCHDDPVIAKATQLLEKMEVKHWHVAVSVGDRRPRVATEEGEQAPDKPFAPFGQQPTLGNRWMIDVQEALAKRPDQIGLSWHWAQILEGDLGKYFAAYFDAVDGHIPVVWQDAFWADLGFRRQRGQTIAVGTTRLYETGPENRRVLKFEHRVAEGTYLLPPDAPLEPTTGVTPVQEGYYLQISLRGPSFAFGHQHFAMLNTKAHLKTQEAQLKAIESTNAIDFPGLDLSKFPNPPITPMIADVRLSYRAGAGTTTKANDGSVTVYHQGPHGFAPVTLGVEAVPLLPRLDADAYLFLGLEGMKAPGMLSLLVQVQAGTGDTELSLPVVTWRYLAGNDWHEFHGSALVADGTQGLRQSGIVQLSIPAAADTRHSSMPDGLTWLAVEVRGATAALDRIAGIHPQAIEVQLEEGAEHSGNLLVAGSLSRPATYISGLKEARQPYSGHGGAAPQSMAQFQTSVSERLRHKNRTVSLWDYERIVLEAFPEVDRVKCIPNTRPGNPSGTDDIGRRDHELSPGHVTIVCIPDTSRLQLSNPLQPRCRRELLTSVFDRLQSQVPPFVTVHVANPDYVAVVVHCQVAFVPGVDAGLGLNWLEQEIAQYLCPWAFDPGAELKFGGKVHANQILYLLEQQPYVDVVAGLTLSREGTTQTLEEISCSSSRQVLVAAQLQPKIQAVSVEEIASQGSEGYGGIGWWRVNEDFFVNGN